MAQTTEIYSVRGEESLGEGALEYSDYIACRVAAETDAAVRCSRDRTIRKVAYYRVDEMGDFRVLLVYENPDPVIRRAQQDRPMRGEGHTTRKERRCSTRRDRRLVDRFLDFLKE